MNELSAMGYITLHLGVLRSGERQIEGAKMYPREMED